MAIITIKKDRFNEFFERSIVKFFNDLNDQNSQGEEFNDIYVAKFNSDDITYSDLLSTKKGIIVLEKSVSQYQQRYMGGYFSKDYEDSNTTALDGAVKISDKSVTVDDSTNYDIGDCLEIDEEVFRRIERKDGNTLHFSHPLTKDYASNSVVKKIDREIRADGFVYCADMRVRLITDTNQRTGTTQKTGKKDLLQMQSFVLKVLQDNETINLHDFDNSRATSMNIKFDANLIQYQEIPMKYNNYQEGVFTIPVWCDIYEINTSDLVVDHTTSPDNRFR